MDERETREEVHTPDQELARLAAENERLRQQVMKGKVRGTRAR